MLNVHFTHRKAGCIMPINRNLAYKVSSFMQIVRDGDLMVIWHSLFGNPKIVSVMTINFIEQFRQPTAFNAVIGDDATQEDIDSISDLVESYFLIPEGFDEREFLGAHMRNREPAIANGSLVDYLELIMSEECNFRCTYCIHFENLETSDRINNSQKFMRFETAREVVDRYLANLRAHQKMVADINFGGGEPLLAWDVVERVLYYCVDTYGGEFQFNFSINTNASLITPKIAEILKVYHVQIASSLDGIQPANDLVRLNKGGGGTFKAIMRGFENLAKAGYPMSGIAVTVAEKNFHMLNESIIDWAVARNMKDVRIDLDVIGMVDVPIEDIVEKLMKIRRYAKKRGIDVPGFWSRAAENLNESTIETRVAFCGAVRGNSICVSPTGKIYSCGYSNAEMGNIASFETFFDPEQPYPHFVAGHLTGTMQMCKGCMIEGQCAGGCNITQEFARATKTAKISRMCDFYRRMTEEILREQLQEVGA